MPQLRDAPETFADHPAQVDLLGRKAFAEALVARIRVAQARAARQEGAGPHSFMLHLEGRWGSGKTSLLGFMRDELRTGDPPWIVVEFNAWQHERVGEPLWFLIRDVYRTAVQEAGTRGRLRLRWDLLAWRLWVGRWRILGFLVSLAVLAGIVAWAWTTSRGEKGSVALIGVVASAATTAIGGIAAARGLVSSTGTARGAESFRQHTANPMRTLKRRWLEIVADAGSPVAIFIDDLDRCRPEYVVEVLEGIQTLLRDAPVTFVVAADRRWLYDSYATVYGATAASDRDAGRPLGHLFLEKTFQVSTSVPRISSGEQSAYWQSLVHEAEDVDAEPGWRERLEHEFAGLRTEEAVLALLERHAEAAHPLRRAARAAAVRQLAKPEVAQHSAQALAQFAPLVESNPRSMKRLVNAYGVELAHHVISGHASELEHPRERLALWTILKSRWPLLAEYLAERPDAVDALRRGEPPPDTEDEPIAKLFRDPAVRRVVDGSVVGVDLDRPSLELLLGGGT